MSKKQNAGWLTYSVDDGETWEAIRPNRAMRRQQFRDHAPRTLRVLAFGAWRWRRDWKWRGK